MASSRYMDDADVLPTALVQRCRAAIGGYYRVITFRVGGPLSKTEEELGPILARECRTALSAHWESQRSIRVYVRGTRNGRISKAEKSAIAYLSRAGHKAEAIADVLGFAVDTIERSNAYTPSIRTLEPRASDEEAGLNVLRKRLGKAHPFRTLADLATRLGREPAVIRARARAAGAAYIALTRATA